MRNFSVGIFLILIINNSFAIGADEAISESVRASAKVLGTSVYTTCILTPPITPPQVAACEALYNSYTAQLAKVAAPGVLAPSTELFHYPSPYDVCRYDASHFVFEMPGVQPYCPALL